MQRTYEEDNERKSKIKNSGITLIALVITIIILLILAGVTLSLTLGENGLLKRAELASEEYNNKKEEEKDKLDELYSSMMVATGDDAKITISMADLKTLIKKEVENNQNKMHSPMLLTEIKLPNTTTNKRSAGTYKASSNKYTKSDSEKFEDYLKYEENKGWTIKKSGFYWISTSMNHEVNENDLLVQCYTRVIVNNVELTLGSKSARTR